MANYVLKNLSLTNPRELSRAIEVVVGCLAEPIQNVSLGLAANTLEVVKKLVEGTALTQINAFAWTRMAEPSAISDELLRLAMQGRLGSVGRTLRFEEHFELPWYDWNGGHSGLMRITYSESHPTPLPPSWANPSNEVVERFGEAVGRARVETCSSWEDLRRTHSYMAVIPIQMTPPIIRRLLSCFDFKDITASWELKGLECELSREMAASKAFQSNYPTGCYHLFGGRCEFSFAVRPSWLTPVLNCSFEDALRVTDRMFEQQSDATMSIRRAFVSWRQANGQAGPRTQGNQIQLHRENERFRLFAGIEQLGDLDPPVRHTSSILREAVARLGAELKPNGW